MIPENADSVISDKTVRQRYQLERLSIRAFEGHEPVATLASLPRCCAPVLMNGDPLQVIGINFWVPEPGGDREAEAAMGKFFAEDALQYVRDHPDEEILTSILYWMGAALHFEERCAGPLQDGFVRRVQHDYPDAVDRMFAAVYRQCPGQLN
jgi:hypothetical protein